MIAFWILIVIAITVIVLAIGGFVGDKIWKNTNKVISTFTREEDVDSDYENNRENNKTKKEIN